MFVFHKIIIVPRWSQRKDNMYRVLQTLYRLRMVLRIGLARNSNRSRIIFSPSLENFRDPASRFRVATRNIAPAFDSPSTHDAQASCSVYRYVTCVPGGRIELPWITPHDFESCASTNSAIPATRH